MGFTIKCDKCGQEQVLTEDNITEQPNIDVTFRDWYGQEIDIVCLNHNCDNSINETEFSKEK
ncbi:hypothetical protein AAHB51_27490 [Bacillus cereus]